MNPLTFLRKLIFGVPIVWWQCAYCKWYFSNRGHVAPIPPRKLSGHGMCADCKEKQLAKLRKAQLEQ